MDLEALSKAATAFSGSFSVNTILSSFVWLKIFQKDNKVNVLGIFFIMTKGRDKKVEPKTRPSAVDVHFDALSPVALATRRSTKKAVSQKRSGDTQ